MGPYFGAVILILVLIIAVVLTFVVSGLLTRRAVDTIVKKFREHQAINATTSISPEDLGLKNRSLLELKAFRDYKPIALQLLIRRNIVRQTEEGRYFLSEEMLSEARERKPG